MAYKTVFTTERSRFHQEKALAAAPDVLDITLLHAPDRDRLKTYLADAVFWISERAGAIDRDLLKAAPHLKLILRLGSMTHDIDLMAAHELGVIVCYWPIPGTIRVAEHAMMQLLVLAKKTLEAHQTALSDDPNWRESCRTDENTFAYNWSGRRDILQLYARSVGLLGFGEIGVELARRLNGWGCRILYHKRSPLPQAVEHELGIVYADPETLWRESHLVVNLLPYAPETDLSIGQEHFAKMPPGGLFISVGSGSVVDEKALADALRSGHLAGAALDTYEWEPLREDNPLRRLALAGYNVLLTPHIAAGTAAAAERAEDYTNVLRYLAQQPILNRLV